MAEAPSHRRNGTAWAFLAPALLLLGLSVLVPAALALLMSVSQSGLDVSEPLKFVGLANLKRLLHDPMFFRVLGTTLVYLVGVVPPIVAGSLVLAVLVNRQLPGIHWFRAAFYAPVLVSIVVAAIAFRWLYAETGLINGWLASLLGPGFAPIGFLTNPFLALPAVMLVTLWKGLGYYMVIFVAGLQGISKDLYEAASLDGSEGWRKHVDITLPLLRPYITLVAVISAIAATKVFDPHTCLLRLRPGLFRAGNQLRLHRGPGLVRDCAAAQPGAAGGCGRAGPELNWGRSAGMVMGLLEAVRSSAKLGDWPAPGARWL